MLWTSSSHELSGKTIVIDLSYLIHRSYKTAGNPEPYPHEDSASNITMKTIHRLERELEPVKTVVALEHGYKHRSNIIEGYKDRGDKDEMLVSEIDIAIRLAIQHGCEAAYAEDLEADDVMATLGMQLGHDCLLITADKDLHQMIGFCHVMDPYQMVSVTEEGVLERWGVLPHQLGDMLALNGDTADCIPGVPGIGPKTAAKMLKEHRTLHGVLSVAEKMVEEKGTKAWKAVLENQKQARDSRSVVQLITNADVKTATVADLPWSERKK